MSDPKRPPEPPEEGHAVPFSDPTPTPRTEAFPRRPTVAPEPHRERLGPYQLRQLLGEGGMGEVWLAEQTAPVRRQVAIKVIKRGMDTRQVIARFEAERQALALMDHPAIAKVLDAGETEHGRPYFVMEYVRGVPINEYCDRHRLGTRHRIELFQQVCEGVQHAHQKALIHRDLKPSNILVSDQDGKPTPKIIDFGVAKATAQPLTERTMYTELGQILGTPEYMSPEQVDLTSEDVDTRSDVYSLGVVLYELLVGTLPFEPRALRSGGYEGIRRVIRDRDPDRPSTRFSALGDATAMAAKNRATEPAALVRQLAGDLDWITMKALEKDRNRRYSSPRELAADLGRYLVDQPVEARPPSTLYRIGKFSRRHRAGVAVAAVLLVLLMGFAVVMAVQANRIARERDQKQRALAEAEAVTGFLTDMLAEAEPERSGRSVTVREVLDKASADLSSAFAAQPLVEARIQETIGNTYMSLGYFEQAEEHLRRNADLREKHQGPEHPSTLQAYFVLANAFYERGNYGEAEALHRRVLAARRRVLGPEHTETLWSMGNLAMVYLAEDRYEDSESLLVDLLAIRRRTIGNEREETLVLINNLAALYHILGRYDEAGPLYREAVEVYERLEGADHPDTLVARQNLGELLADQGKLEEAEPILRATLEDKRRVYGDEHPRTLYTIGILGRLYLNAGRYEEAEPLLREAVEGERKRLGGDHERIRTSLERLARCYVEQGDPERAEPLLEELIQLCSRAGDEVLLATARADLACVRAAQERRGEALDLLAQAVDGGWAQPERLDHPALASLAGDPRFDALAARVRAHDSSR